MPDDTETVWIELSGEEGFNFEDLRVSEIRGGASRKVVSLGLPREQKARSHYPKSCRVLG